MNPGNQDLERVLQSAIVVSWADLMHGVQTGLIHIEYGFATGGTLDYLKLWSSVSRGHWLLACEYWMSASTFHHTGVHRQRISLARLGAHPGISDATPIHIQPSNGSWETRITPDPNAYGRR